MVVPILGKQDLIIIRVYVAPSIEQWSRTIFWLPRDTPCSISVSKMTITGEPVDKLFVWGHSTCTLNNIHMNEVLVFGGFGGVGRHALRNDTLIMDTQTGTLKAMKFW